MDCNSAGHLILGIWKELIIIDTKWNKLTLIENHIETLQPFVLKTIPHLFKLWPCLVQVNRIYRLNNETTIYITTIQTWIRYYETTFYVDYYKGFALSQFQSHKLVSIPFRVNWLILRSIIVQQRCRDSRNHRERNG